MTGNRKFSDKQEKTLGNTNNDWKQNQFSYRWIPLMLLMIVVHCVHRHQKSPGERQSMEGKIINQSKRVNEQIDSGKDQKT